MRGAERAGVNLLQEQFWKEFWRLKVQAKYIDLHLARTETADRGLKIALAVTSSASIGSWALWKEYAFVWATAIAVSQVIAAVRPFLPYKDRLRSLAGLLGDLEEQAVQVEDKWLRISAGDLTEDEIRKALSDLRTKRNKAFNKHFPSTHLPERASLLRRAEDCVQSYFDHLYPTSFAKG